MQKLRREMLQLIDTVTGAINIKDLRNEQITQQRIKGKDVDNYKSHAV